MTDQERGAYPEPAPATGEFAAEKSIASKFQAKEEAWRRRGGFIPTKHTIYQGDARRMSELGDGPGVHLVVTSPPYWNLKAYPGTAEHGQLGDISDYEPFLRELQRVWRRCLELLFPGSRLCVVVGDVCLPRRKFGRHFVVPLHSAIIQQCVGLGFDYLSPIFWYKIANAKTEVAGNGGVFLGKPYEPNAVVKNDVEYVLIFRKPGGYRHPSEEQRNLSVLSKEDHSRWFRQVWMDVPGQSTTNGHPAPFPEELAYRLISMFSFVEDIVLDPFCGTATTTRAAIRASRSSISYEVEPDYIRLVAERFGQLPLGASVKVVSAPPNNMAE